MFLKKVIFIVCACCRYTTRSITVLELSHYLENYLWLRFEPSLVTKPLLMSIVLMVNEKFREHVPAWEVRKREQDVKHLVLISIR